MIHNAWAEMGANAKLFYDAFRGLCRMRINYARERELFYNFQADNSDYKEAMHYINFWSKVKEYWEGKLKLSYQWEKDYFGSENEKPLGSEM